MLHFLRKKRRELANNNQLAKYLRYAIGEIVLVVLGILIALAINNYKERTKSRATEIYLLQEVLNNLKEDSDQIKIVLIARTHARDAVNRMLTNVPTNAYIKDSLYKDMGRFLTFERYYPLNNAYEMLKSSEIKLENKHLRLEISRYYDYEQNILISGVKDIESVFMSITLNDQNEIMKQVDHVTNDFSIVLKNPNNQDFQEALLFQLNVFKYNNLSTLAMVEKFYRKNQNLREQINKELELLKNK